MSVTVAVVTYQRLAKLQKMLPSLGSALAIPNLNIDVKIIFYINGADHQSVNFIRESNLSIQLIESSEILTPGAARNIILKSIETEWVCFFDDDIIVPEIFFKKFNDLVKEYPDVGVWGGPNVTPLDSSPFEFDIGFILSSYFVTGPVSKRYRSVADNMVGSELNLSLCNLIVRSYILKTEKFNNHVITAEENELLYRLRKQNIQMRYSNFLAVGHYRRPSSKYFLNQIKYYGFGRGQVLRIHGYPLQSTFLLAGITLCIYVFKAYFVLFPILLLVANFIHYSLDRKKINIQILFLPLKIWFMYGFGICLGFFNKKKILFHKTVRSVDQSPQEHKS